MLFGFLSSPYIPKIYAMHNQGIKHMPTYILTYSLSLNPSTLVNLKVHIQSQIPQKACGQPYVRPMLQCLEVHIGYEPGLL